jgi:hypothetical protein
MFPSSVDQLLDQCADACAALAVPLPACTCYDHPGHDLVSAALRAQPDAGSMPVTVSDKDIRCVARLRPPHR